MLSTLKLQYSEFQVTLQRCRLLQKPVGSELLGALILDFGYVSEAEWRMWTLDAMDGTRRQAKCVFLPCSGLIRRN